VHRQGVGGGTERPGIFTRKTRRRLWAYPKLSTVLRSAIRNFSTRASAYRRKERKPNERRYGPSATLSALPFHTAAHYYFITNSPTLKVFGDLIKLRARRDTTIVLIAWKKSCVAAGRTNRLRTFNVNCSLGFPMYRVFRKPSNASGDAHFRNANSKASMR
jgi:hypothetical protein